MGKIIMDNRDLILLRRWVLHGRVFNHWENRIDITLLLLIAFQMVTCCLFLDSIGLFLINVNMTVAMTFNILVKQFVLQLVVLCLDNPYISSKIDLFTLYAGLPRLRRNHVTCLTTNFRRQIPKWRLRKHGIQQYLQTDFLLFLAMTGVSNTSNGSNVLDKI